MADVTKSISITMPEAMYEKALVQAATRGLRPSHMVRMLLYDYLNRSPAKGVVALYEADMAELRKLIDKYESLCHSLGVEPVQAQHLGAERSFEGGSK